MRLLSLTLEHFRSYPSLELVLEENENVSVLLGENATGKTNILEAIAILSLLKSPRRADEVDMIAWEKDFYRITGKVRSDRGEEFTMEVASQVQPAKKRASFINGVKTPAKRYVGTLPLVTFMPDDLTLFTGSPSARRKLLDGLLCQVSPAYLQALSEYERAVRQRNTLLKHIKEGLEKPHSLNTWDEKIATLGAIITLDRLQLMETMQMTITKEMHSLGEKVTSANFTYLRKGKETSEALLREELKEQLLHYRERDCLILATTVGPHRDDWTLSLNEREITTFASRGQQRAALLALLLLQASFLELRKGEKPILLLDDIFSELDEKHRAAVLDTLSDHQVIVSAIELDASLREKAKVLVCPIS